MQEAIEKYIHMSDPGFGEKARGHLHLWWIMDKPLSRMVELSICPASSLGENGWHDAKGEAAVMWS